MPETGTYQCVSIGTCELSIIIRTQLRRLKLNVHTINSVLMHAYADRFAIRQ